MSNQYYDERLESLEKARQWVDALRQHAMAQLDRQQREVELTRHVAICPFCGKDEVDGPHEEEQVWVLRQVGPEQRERFLETRCKS